MTRDQERSLWLHRAVAERLAIDPTGVLALAWSNLARYRRVHRDGRSEGWFAQWEALPTEGRESVERTLVSPSPAARELRATSPFAGVLTPRERKELLHRFRAQGDRAA